MSTPKLFSPYHIQDLTLKNRIVMSPMCMYSSNEQGLVKDWHLLHYSTRAVGQVGLIMLEATAVNPQGRITNRDLGIWNDEQINGLTKLVNHVHQHGAKIGIQLAHAGRKAELAGEIIAPSAIRYNQDYKVPEKMSLDLIKKTIKDFQEGAIRAKKAGFDVIEIHAAHGYLVNQFLTPLLNKREDSYGGSAEKRYQFLKQIIDSVRDVWKGPLLVRISANDYHSDGNQPKDFINYAKLMHEQGVNLIDCSSGGVVPAKIDAYPGYQVNYAELIKKNTNIATGAVGLITTAKHAEAILKNKRANLVFLGRELLRNPYWPRTAAQELGYEINSPTQYERAWH